MLGVVAASRLRRLSFAAAAIFLFAASSAMASCGEDDDPRRWINGGGKCLAMRLAGRTVGAARTLVILLHGDVSVGKPADYLYEEATALGTGDTISAAIIRPGYEDKAGNRSEGSNKGYRDNYDAESVDAIADAIQKLKARHGILQTIIVGHSGGAAIAGVILGRHVGLADAAVLVSCPCNVPEWRRSRQWQGRSTWWRSLSPHSYAEGVPLDARVVAVTGKGDANTTPWLAWHYVELQRTRGVDAAFLEVPGGHSFGALWPAVKRTVEKLAAH